MEQTALRPKPMPGQQPGKGSRGPCRCPPAARRRGRRLATLVCGLLAGAVLVLTGAGLGAAGVTVIGGGVPAELRRLAAGHEAPPAPSGRKGTTPSAASTPAYALVRPTLGIEAVDDDRSGAEVVGVHIPGPGYSAGLVRGDAVVRFGRTRIGSAADLARAVARARPGREVALTVRHRDGSHRRLSVTPGVVT
ncbi:PDZ domain-containing protein [Streptomyces sp. Li-HN-5-11]|uniref:PDZ domain-containing protein n=1 Tax=Streptomyces sp. Li-HN-5-11 TaxID=3075432 RepID=UPI0028ABADEB|nr:PDZ domain-containing protein [Streptomyces sp. Li-HN-5-11]WNM30984.1 PDZ domain-containing protein [Streptomyces sp. Li-HN-5-11]